jgi:hypothetical protein
MQLTPSPPVLACATKLLSTASSRQGHGPSNFCSGWVRLSPKNGKAHWRWVWRPRMAGGGSSTPRMRRVRKSCACYCVIEHAQVRQLAVRDNILQGLHAATPQGAMQIATSQIILATGGIGGLFAHTTNPRGATGSGLAPARCFAISNSSSSIPPLWPAAATQCR